MGLSTDVLTRATPTRLICRGGRWMLELSRLEAVDRDVFQPRLTRVEGAESILAALRRNEEGQHLVTGAAQLMRGSRGEEDRIFEISDGDWIPSLDPSFPPLGPQQPRAEAQDMARALAELRAELVVLRASHARLRERVIALEAAQSGLPVPSLRRGVRSGRRRSEPPPPMSPVPSAGELPRQDPAFAATQASPGFAPGAPAPSPAPADVEGAAGAAVAAVASGAAASQAAPGQAAFDELVAAVAGEQQLPALGVPTLGQLNECLGTLMDGAPSLERHSEQPLESLTGARACKLLDDEGRERGAIVVDLRAAVLLGAQLLALPKAEALRQVQENEPSEDALLAMSEICNNLTGPVNAVAGNAHVRSTALVEVDPATLPKPRARLDASFEDSLLVVAMF